MHGGPTSYGMLRMSGGDMVQRGGAGGVSGGGGPSPPDRYMHWNMPPTIKLEDSVVGPEVESFQAREMSDVIENIIRQQQQQLPADFAFSLHQHQQQGSLAGGVAQSPVVTTGAAAADSLQSYLAQTTAATVNVTPDFISSLPPPTVAATRPAAFSSTAAAASSPALDASDWIRQLPDDLSGDTAPAGLTSCLSDTEEPDPDIEAQVQAAMSYWLHPDLPDENVMLAERHWDILNRVVPAYNSFVQLGNNVNRKLKIKFDEWSKEHPNVTKQERSDWIQSEVIPVYTLSSISYFKSLPGFNELSAADQGTLIRLGQSQSRILVAALHWYDPEENSFRHFLSWRIMPPGQVDHFRQKLIDYSKRVSVLELDPIEAALLNVLVVIASDYQGLEGTALIEEYRRQILCTFRAYTTAKFGTPNTRLETLFKYIPDVRRLGLWHYKMTTDPSLGVAQQQQQS